MILKSGIYLKEEAGHVVHQALVVELAHVGLLVGHQAAQHRHHGLGHAAQRRPLVVHQHLRHGMLLFEIENCEKCE